MTPPGSSVLDPMDRGLRRAEIGTGGVAARSHGTPAMRLPHLRFTVRRMMIAVAVLGLLLTVVPPWWRYWFQSPWRLVTITNYRSPDGTINAAEVCQFYDIRKPADAARFQAMTSWAPPSGFHYKVERFATFPRSRFPTFTDADVLRI